MHAHLCVLNGTWPKDSPAVGWVPNHLVLCMDGLRRGSGYGNHRRWAWAGRCMTAPVWSRWLAREVQVRKACHPCAVCTTDYCTPALAAATAAATYVLSAPQTTALLLLLLQLLLLLNLSVLMIGARHNKELACELRQYVTQHLLSRNSLNQFP